MDGRLFAAAVLLLLIAGAYIYVTGYTTMIKDRFNGLSTDSILSVTVYDAEGNPVKVVKPGSPLSVLKSLSLYSGGTKLGWIQTDVTTNVKFSGISSYSYTVVVYVYVYDAYTNALLGNKAYSNTGTESSTSFTRSFHITAQDIMQMIGNVPNSQHSYRVMIQAKVSVSSGDMNDEATSKTVEVDLIWKPDNMLSIVSVDLTANPVSGWGGR